jgi:hypothetical protein
MAIYTVHLPRDRSPEAVERGVVLVRDGFAFWAMIFGPLWFLRHREWLGLVGWLVIAVLIELSARWLGTTTAGGFELLLAIATGVVANDIRRLTLSLRGRSEAGVVEGDGVIAAERRFFADWLSRLAAPSPTTPTSTPTLRPVPTGVIGLFPESGVPQ